MHLSPSRGLSLTLLGLLSFSALLACGRDDATLPEGDAVESDASSLKAPIGPVCTILNMEGSEVVHAYINYKQSALWTAKAPQQWLGGFHEMPWRSGYVYNTAGRPVAFVDGNAPRMRVYAVTDDTTPPTRLVADIGYTGGTFGGEFGVIRNADGITVGHIGGLQCRPFRGQDTVDRNIAAAGAFFAFFANAKLP
jgi:hypothetical protein